MNPANPDNPVQLTGSFGNEPDKQEFYRHPEPLLRGNCTENLAAWILDSSAPERTKLLRKFKGVFIHWLQNEAEDAWVLDHLYRLFNQLEREGQHADIQPLLDGGVSRLLGADDEWYTIGRQEFLLRIEERARMERGWGPRRGT